MFLFLAPVHFECTLLQAAASYFVGNEGSAVSSCVWPSIPSKCGNTELMFDVKNVVRDNREKESEISSTPTPSSRVLVLTASCKELRRRCGRCYRSTRLLALRFMASSIIGFQGTPTDGAVLFWHLLSPAPHETKL